MNPMTAKWLTIWLSDEFHDWIDGDDPVDFYSVVSHNSINVVFESGARFNIKVTEL